MPRSLWWTLLVLVVVLGSTLMALGFQLVALGQEAQLRQETQQTQTYES